MAFVFYDVETTGLDRRYDQILGFAAIRTDEDLTETGRYVEDCGLMPHVVPHPAALERNGLTAERLAGPDRATHYGAMRSIYRQLEEWGGALYVGYNSIAFDEEFLRQAFFLTLHPPYLTSMPGNGRADALSLARTVALLRPGALRIGDRDGCRSFRLDDMCAANGIAHENAHTALGDVLATIELCRLARDADEEVWTRFLRNSTKSAVAEVVDVEAAFLHVRLTGNDAQLEILTSLASDDLNPSTRLCLPLSFDVEKFKTAPNEDAAAMVRGRGGLRVLKLNKAPVVCALDAAPEGAVAMDQGLALSVGATRREDDALRRRFCEIVRTSTPERPAPVELEDMLYHALPDARDRPLQARFHAAAWEERAGMIRSFHDPRHRAIARRLVLLERPDLLDVDTRRRLTAAMDERLMRRLAVVREETQEGRA